MFNTVNEVAPNADVLEEQVIDVSLLHPPQCVLLAQNTWGGCGDVLRRKRKFSLNPKTLVVLQLDLKDNAVDVTRPPTDKVVIAIVHPSIGEEQHKELHGGSWVFHHNVPGHSTI